MEWLIFISKPAWAAPTFLGHHAAKKKNSFQQLPATPSNSQPLGKNPDLTPCVASHHADFSQGLGELQHSMDSGAGQLQG